MKNKILILTSLSLILFTGCGREKVTPTPKPSKAQSMYYVAVDKASVDFNQELVPAGSLIDSCGNYLSLRMGGEYEYTTIPQHLTRVFDDMQAFSGEGMFVNPLKRAGVALVGITQDKDTLVITLTGSLPKTDDPCFDAQPRLQLENTIKQNIGSNKYRVEWK